MSWGGGILFYIGKTLFKRYKKRKNIEKLKAGKADKIEWIYGDIPTQCHSCHRVLENSFITGWDESIFMIMCPDCYETFESELRDVTAYNLRNVVVARDEDTPERREKSQRIRRTMGWG